MKQFLSIKIVAIFIAFTLIGACTGNKDLIQGEWLMDWYFVNGEGQDKNTTLSWTFDKDGSFRQIMENPFGREELKGSWSIDEGSNSLIMFYTSTQAEVLWVIAKLEKDYMEVNYTIPGFFVERGFKKQH